MKSADSKTLLEWTKRLQSQAESRKSIKLWCKEQSISYNTFMYWRNRLKKPEDQIHRDSFIECPEEIDTWIEISLQGAKLMLSRNFDRASLLFCLKVFGGH